MLNETESTWYIGDCLPIAIAQDVDDNGCGAVKEMSGSGERSTRRKPSLVPHGHHRTYIN
jgi:hypothetical protein